MMGNKKEFEYTHGPMGIVNEKKMPGRRRKLKRQTKFCLKFHAFVHRIKGSVTIEAAVALPVFLSALLSIAALMQYPLVYGRVGNALTDTARILSANGYLLSLSGLEGAHRTAEKTVNNVAAVGDKEIEKVLRLLESFGVSETVTSSVADIQVLKGSLRAGAATQAGDFVDAVYNKVVLQIAGDRLQLAGTAAEGRDPWIALGIQGGVAGVNLSNSSYFTENNTLELVAVYTIKPPALFRLAPAVRCSNRVRVFCWGAGAGGSSGEKTVEESDAGQGSNTSIWHLGNDPSHLWERGQIVEKGELDKQAKTMRDNGTNFMFAQSYQKGFDGLAYRTGVEDAVVYEVFSLNPFLPSYFDKPNKVADLLQEKIEEMPGYLADIVVNEGCYTVKECRVQLVVPENAPFWINEVVEEVQAMVKKDHVQIDVVRAYGTYDNAVKN